MTKEEEFIISVPIKKGFVSEFFDHMVAYGGFSFEDGIMRVWGDPSFFTPLRGFAILYSELKKSLGKEANDIFYWIGKLYGRNSSILLMQKFGFDKKKLPDFVNGATQDGFGYIELQSLKHNDKETLVEISGIKSNLSLNYKKLFGKQKEALDYYMLGILSGGSEPLFERTMAGVEKMCMAKGDKKCHYSLCSISDYKSPGFFKKFSLKEDYINQKTKLMALKRQSSFKLLQSKNISFGDGNFILNGVQGFNISVYEHVLIDKIMRDLLGQKRFEQIKSMLAKIYVEDTFNKTLKTKNMTGQDVQRVLDRLKIFGFGTLSMYRYSPGSIIIENKNNPYLLDMRDLLGEIDASSLYFLSQIIREAFYSYFGKKVKVEIMKNDIKGNYIKINF